LHYRFAGEARRWVDWFAAHPAMALVLYEAVRPLYQAFGRIMPLTLTLVPDPEGGDAVARVVVQVPADWQGDPDEALRTFDEVWWLRNCSRSGGLVVWDAEQAPAPVPVLLDASED
jgi:hypothetical protein